MIKPTVGRVVWFHPSGSIPEDQPCAAIVAHVWDDTCVNLAIFTQNGGATNQTSVFLYQGEGDRPAPSESYCEWMPFQHGQAAKTEALEKLPFQHGQAAKTEALEKQLHEKMS